MEQEQNEPKTSIEVHDPIDEGGASGESFGERAVQLKTQLADRLEGGASRLRQRATNTAKLDDAIATTKERVADASDRVAMGMERSADWLRNANASSFQREVERQVRENSGRTLLIAGAIGYVLGRVLKGKSA